MTTVQALRREVARLAATRGKADGPPELVIELPRNGRGPEADFRMGTGLVRFFDPAEKRYAHKADK